MMRGVSKEKFMGRMSNENYLAEITAEQNFELNTTMARPMSAIILSMTDSKTFKAEQVLCAEAVYAVYYAGRPINRREVNTVTNGGTKYKKTAFSTPAPAFNLAGKLNRLFKTDEFAVYRHHDRGDLIPSRSDHRDKPAPTGHPARD